ncbi:MAG TPA: DUF4190 domain-containing protein [Acidothermaceae bacterium]|jgi:hypothetical protein
MTTFENSSTVSSKSNGLAVAGMVCGIVGLVLFNVILGPLAIIFGCVGLARANRGASHHHMAVAGIVLGVVDIALFVVLLVAASHNGGSLYFHVG